MAELRIDLELVTYTGLSVGAGGSAGTIADRSILRDGYGRPIIPASQVKGKARHAAEALLATLTVPHQNNFDDDSSPDNPIRRIFGSPKSRSPLRFADLVCTLDPALVRHDNTAYLRPSVAINRRRGVAEDEHLLLIETAREGLHFNATPAITGVLDQLSDAALLWAALRLNQLWGGAKSRGLGSATLTIQVLWAGEAQADSQLAAALRQITSSGAPA